MFTVFIAIALACNIVFCALLFSALRYDFGRHDWDIKDPTFIKLQHRLYISYILYDPTILLAKLAILDQFLRIFSGTYRNRFWYATVGLAWFNILFYIPETIALIFSCSPRKKIWDPSTPGHCINQTALLMTSGPFNILSDFQIFILPIWAIWKLQLPLKKRFSVSAGFAIGFLGCVCSAIRTAYTIRLLGTDDESYRIAQNQLWANAECTLAILIASLIILPRYIRSFQPGHKITGSTESSNTYGSRNQLAQKRRSAGASDQLDPALTVDAFDWEAAGAIPQGRVFNQIATHRVNTDTTHSRLSEELDLQPEDRARIAPWPEPANKTADA